MQLGCVASEGCGGISREPDSHSRCGYVNLLAAAWHCVRATSQYRRAGRRRRLGTWRARVAQLGFSTGIAQKASSSMLDVRH